MIACECHHCDEVSYVANSAAGTKIACPNCTATVKVPNPTATTAAPPVVRVEHPGLEKLDNAWFAGKWVLILFIIACLFSALAKSMIDQATGRF